MTVAEFMKRHMRKPYEINLMDVSSSLYFSDFFVGAHLERSHAILCVCAGEAEGSLLEHSLPQIRD